METRWSVLQRLRCWLNTAGKRTKKKNNQKQVIFRSELTFSSVSLLSEKKYRDWKSSSLIPCEIRTQTLRWCARKNTKNNPTRFCVPFFHDTLNLDNRIRRLLASINRHPLPANVGWQRFPSWLRQFVRAGICFGFPWRSDEGKLGPGRNCRWRLDLRTNYKILADPLEKAPIHIVFSGQE